MGSFELDYVEDGDPDIALVALVGELDLTNADELTDRLEALADGRSLLLDLNRLLFLDSAALHRLFRLAGERGRDGLAIVIEPGAPVAGVLEIVEFRRAATVFETRDEARAALAPAS